MRAAGGADAFTLIEVLVVVALIAVLAGIFGIALRGGDATVGLASAERIVAGLARAARAQAVLQQAPARLIIYADETHPEKGLRYVGIVGVDMAAAASGPGSGPPGGGPPGGGPPGGGPPGGPGAAPPWTSINEPTILPDGVFLDPALSGVDGDDLDVARYRYPEVRMPPGQGDPYFYIEFNEFGQVRSDQAGARVVFSTGYFDASAPGGGRVVLNSEDADSLELSGFMILRLGGIARAQDPDDLRR